MSRNADRLPPISTYGRAHTCAREWRAPRSGGHGCESMLVRALTCTLACTTTRTPLESERQKRSCIAKALLLNGPGLL